MSGNDDVLCVALLFCATFGVGSMSFGSIFAAAGPVLAAMGVYFISACNLHASVAISKSLMVAPVNLPEASLARKVASALMLAHVTIAFPLLLNPTLFDMERYILGKDADHEVLQQTLSLRAAKANATSGQSKPILANTGAIGTLAPPKITTTPILEEEGFLYGNSTPYFQAASPPPSDNGDHAYAGEAYTASDRLCSGLIRTITVWSQAFLAIMFQSSFTDILSLIGATAVTVSCMIMPCLCYLRVHPIATQTFRGKCDRFVCHLTIISSIVLGIYCALIAIGNISRDLQHFHLFQSAETSMAANTTLGDEYPYCHEGERN
ncbi:hypothetical protein PC118_g23516 [Phytophthora cactorum]|uniref:Amino acid transporter transmembrane domain-containing protein n=1 Tax=Phytophthora cactorum TaxID=29920 RepID=A0A8T1EQH5_9STRA|nr:hypothetical protein PC118_g23516 [Phytophthora cactorum]